MEDFYWKLVTEQTQNMFVPGPSMYTEINYNREQLDIAEKSEGENRSFIVFIPRKEWHKPFVVKAKEKELKNFQDYGAYLEVPDVGQPKLTSGWVVKEKMYGDVIECKARLVVHGNQEIEEVQSDSPTVTKQSLRMVYTLAAQYGWEVVTLDVTSRQPSYNQINWIEKCM